MLEAAAPGVSFLRLDTFIVRRVITGSPRPARRTHLSLPRYGALLSAGLALTGLQLLLLPRWLTAFDFGLVVLSVSVTQAILQFGDLGLSRLSIDSGRPADEQASLRIHGQALTIMTVGAFLGVLSALWFLTRAHSVLLLALALGALAAVAVSGDKYRAALNEVAGDEAGAANHNFLWTNASKAGLIAGAVFVHAAVPILAAGTLTGAALCAPYWAPLRRALPVVKAYRLWALPVASVLSPFVIGWADTYFLTAHLGIASGGSYQALYRLLAVTTYLYLPWGSVVSSRVNARETRPLLRPTLMALGATAAGLAVATAFAVVVAPWFFPNFRLPLAALPSLLALNLLSPLSYCFGTALYARANVLAIASANVAGMVLVLVGHTLFTLHGTPATAATVSLAGMAVATAGQMWAYLRAGRSV